VHLVGSYVEVLCKLILTACDFGCPPENLAMDTGSLAIRRTPSCGSEKKYNAVSTARLTYLRANMT
jgi:hypothetical protein